MVEAVRKHVDAGGVQPVGFYYERFALSGTGAAARTEVPAEPEVVAEAEAPTVAAPPVPERAPAAVEVAAVLTGPEGRSVAGQDHMAQQGACATRRCRRRDVTRR